MQVRKLASPDRVLLFTDPITITGILTKGKRHREDMQEYKNVTPVSFAGQWQDGQNKSMETLKVLKKFGGVV